MSNNDAHSCSRLNVGCALLRTLNGTRRLAWVQKILTEDGSVFVECESDGNSLAFDSLPCDEALQQQL